jgi:trehalose 6-phosphate synthase
MVVLTDVLPGFQLDQDAAIGLNGHPDEPQTTALSALVTRRDGVWIGRPQAHPPANDQFETLGIDLGADLDGYLAQSDSTIWPLFHDLARPASHAKAWRVSYRRANQEYARVTAQRAAIGATVWVHDYHLQLVPAMLRELRPDVRIAFYLTTMFPSADLIRHTPMHRELVIGLLGADLVGFQSASAAENFLRLKDDPEYVEPALREGGGRRSNEVAVGVYPTSVDTAAIDAAAARPYVRRRSAEIRASLGNPSVLVLSIDPPTEAAGIDHRLRALGRLLAAGTLRPDDLGIIQFVTDQETATSEDVSSDVAREVARINGQYATVGRPCVHFVRESPNLEERVALYLAANVFIASPLRAGATINGLEFAATGSRNSALVLSEFSGTATVLPEAFQINPYDEDQFCTGIVAAITARPDERRQRLAAMRTYLSSYDTHAWLRLFLNGLHEGPDARPAEASDENPQSRRNRRPVPRHARPRTTRTSGRR